MEPNFGDRVFVRPLPGLKVQVDGIIGRFMSDEIQEVIWSEWYHRRFRDGSIQIVAPSHEEEDSI